MIARSLALVVLLFPAAAAADDRMEHFVRVSPRDGRYFELDDGRPYVPVGLNMIGPPREGGLEGMEAWFEALSANRGDFVRIWLARDFFDIEHEQSGRYDEEQARRIDALLEIARRHGIRLKLCLEHFRHLGEGRQVWFGKPIHHADQGGPAAGTAEFFDSETCRQQFKRKLAWYQDRYGDDPAVFGWELWNEMDCITAGDWADWTEEMLDELHRLFPKNLALQSLGSFDTEAKRDRYRRLAMIAGNDVLQAHRYLDLGARLEVCHGPVDVLAADAVEELLAFGVRKPVLLAESGGVEPSHSGPLKLYEKDTAGIILHDVLFAPFFAGAAGSGQIWHWDVYVDRMNLWHHFSRFAEAVEGLDPPAENFRPVQVAHPRLRIRALVGGRTVLAWCRDSRNTWQTELAEGRPPEVLRGQSFELPLPRDQSASASVTFYDPWTQNRGSLTVKGDHVELPDFSRSIVVRVERPFDGLER